MAVQEALEQAIHAVAPAATINIGNEHGHWSGFVVAPEFHDMTHLARQQAVWKRIRLDLGADAVEVGTLLLYSPEEFDAVEDEE